MSDDPDFNYGLEMKARGGKLTHVRRTRSLKDRSIDMRDEPVAPWTLIGIVLIVLWWVLS